MDMNDGKLGVLSEKGKCAECGKRLVNDETVFFGGTAVCAECKDKHLQKIREGVDS